MSLLRSSLSNATCVSKQTPMGVVRLSAPRAPRRSLKSVVVAASEDDAEQKKLPSRETEPEEYWKPKSEREGANPMADPIAIMGVVGILFPFVLLGIAAATGVIDTSVYR